jgi:hypothetical protein
VKRPKITCRTETRINGAPDGVLKSGARLDQLIDALTTAQETGAPDDANVVLTDSGRRVMITWEEER